MMLHSRDFIALRSQGNRTLSCAGVATGVKEQMQGFNARSTEVLKSGNSRRLSEWLLELYEYLLIGKVELYEKWYQLKLLKNTPNKLSSDVYDNGPVTVWRLCVGHLVFDVFNLFFCVCRHLPTPMKEHKTLRHSNIQPISFITTKSLVEHTTHHHHLSFPNPTAFIQRTSS